ncbi:hypothetical protein HF1_04720 [Mycoplasma haemofelis str. Langford 1]|uniref:Uncharacterized protein n=1 Tax=Mycoplasma haemofelis (strain Langford 1) TaxID=941640 RepID=E8ZH59_MYCHL|nr:hypothetical protein [Mycoplasma haemofelis]CBY92480.1 hypothetical protein HF1_04720 [Mycoplasma haemofelis str. Langford 1]
MIKYGLASTAALGAAGTGVWYSGILSDTSRDISSLAREDKTIILVKEDSEWNEKWDLYKSNNSNKGTKEDVWKLEGWVSPAPSEILKTFKDRCSSILLERVKSKEDTRYQNAVKYCFRDKKISDLFKEKGVTLLTKESSHDEKWKTRWEKFKEDTKASLQGFTIAESETKENSFSKLSGACETAFNKPIKEEAYLNNFESIKKWCSSESTFS